MNGVPNPYAYSSTTGVLGHGGGGHGHGIYTHANTATELQVSPAAAPVQPSTTTAESSNFLFNSVLPLQECTNEYLHSSYNSNPSFASCPSNVLEWTTNSCTPVTPQSMSKPGFYNACATTGHSHFANAGTTHDNHFRVANRNNQLGQQNNIRKR